jgi:hypothetical protein
LTFYARVLTAGSLILGLQASLARMQVLFRVIAMRQIRIAQMGTMLRLTRDMEPNMDKRL